MKLRKFDIEGFRRIKKASVLFGDATFFIGENNVGKSSVFRAIEKYFNVNDKCDLEDFFSDESGSKVDEIVLTGEFIKLPPESVNWPGFKGRVLIKEENGDKDYRVLFRKSYSQKGDIKKEMKIHKRILKTEFLTCLTLNDFISAGITEERIKEVFGENDPSRKLSQPQRKNLDEIDELWDFDLTQEDWFINPGGIEGNISVKLPRFLLIPAEHKLDEITSSKGVLQKTMLEIFKEVRDSSENYKKAQEYLDLLSKELDPKDEEKEFGKMMIEVNSIVKEVFAETSFIVDTKLSEPDKVLNPTFEVAMASNIKTSPDRQGLGAIRSAVFALLRYRENFLERKKIKDIDYIRGLIICFEEPEIYLHPNAANMMRDNIYNLSISSTSQIICSTHSPYMIDISKDLESSVYPKQLLNLFRLEKDEDTIVSSHITSFNVTEQYEKLQSTEKDFVKFILKMDDHIARVFFARKILVIEGDTEDIVLRETIKRIDLETRKRILSNYQIIKARGKAAIIALVKYLKALGLQPFVLHDKDTIGNATKFNGPIKIAVGGETFRYMIENCIEDVLGYQPPGKDKPFTAYKFICDNWGTEWDSITPKWKEIVEKNIFVEEFKARDLNEHN